MQFYRIHRGDVTYCVTSGSDSSSPAIPPNEGYLRCSSAHGPVSAHPGSFLSIIDVTHCVTMPMVARIEEGSPPICHRNAMRYKADGQTPPVGKVVRAKPPSGDIACDVTDYVTSCGEARGWRAVEPAPRLLTPGRPSGPQRQARTGGPPTHRPQQPGADRRPLIAVGRAESPTSGYPRIPWARW